MSAARRPGPRIPGVSQLRPPGEPLNEHLPPTEGAGALAPAEPAEAVAPAAAPTDKAVEPSEPCRGRAASRRPAAVDEEPAAVTGDRGARRSRRPGAMAFDAVDMTGSRRQQFNAYVDDRVKSHYDRLVFELRGTVQGRTNLSEFVRALLEEGPATAEDARALILRSRARHQET